MGNWGLTDFPQYVCETFEYHFYLQTQIDHFSTLYPFDVRSFANGILISVLVLCWSLNLISFYKKKSFFVIYMQIDPSKHTLLNNSFNIEWMNEDIEVITTLFYIGKQICLYDTLIIPQKNNNMLIIQNKIIFCFVNMSVTGLPPWLEDYSL